VVAQLRARYTQPVTIALLGLVGSVVIGVGVVGTNPTATRLSSLIVAFSALTIAVALPAERVFLGWLCVAPLVQERILTANLGSRLSQPLYQAPPLLLLLLVFLQRRRVVRGMWYDALPIVYFGFLTVQLSLSHWVTHDRATYRALYYTTGVGIVAYYVAAFGLPRLQPEHVARAFLGSGLVVGLLTLVQKASGWSPWADNGWPAEGRVVGPLQNPAVLGTFLGAVVVFAAAMFVSSFPRGVRRLAAAAGGIGAVGVLLTYTRASIGAALGVAVLIMLLRRRSRLTVVGVLVCAGVLIAASWGKIETTAAYRERLSNRTNIEARALIQDWSLQLARQRPFFGWGYGSFDQVKRTADLRTNGVPIAFGEESTSHNTFLTILVENGMVGLLLLLVPVILISVRIGKVALVPGPYQWYLAGILGVVAVYIVNASAIDMRFFAFVPALLWVFAGLGRRLTLDEVG
jgi:O-antigen ligase